MQTLTAPPRPRTSGIEADPDRHPVRRGRSHFALSCATGSALAAVVFTWMASDGTWNLLQRRYTTNFYDVQARSLLAGHWWMPSGVLGLEAFHTGSRSYMYFGPVPALLRIPLLVFTHRLDGRLTGVSMLLGEVVALAFTSGLAWQVRRRVRGPDAPVSRAEAVFTGVALFVVGCGSTLLYLASWPSVYNEAEIWGAALALGSMYFLVRFLTIRSARYLVLTGLFAGLTLFTRAPIGAGVLLSLLILGILELARAVRQPGSDYRWALALGATVLIPLGLYAAINEVKFNMLFGLPFQRSAQMHVFPFYRYALGKNGGTLFRLHFLPTSLLAYMRPDALRFTSWFPWVTFLPPTILGHVQYVAVEFPPSAVATMPAMVVLAAIGTVMAFKPHRRSAGRDRRLGPSSAASDLAVLRVPAVGMAGASASIFVFGNLTGRYLGDLLPFLILTGTAGFAVVAAASRRTTWHRVLVTALCGLALFGTWAQFSLALLYQRSVTGQYEMASARADFVSLREEVDGAVLGDRLTGVRPVQKLPVAPGDVGTLAVTSDCSALYESNGLAWVPVELSHAAGHFRFAVSAPPDRAGSSWPLLASGRPGTADVLALHELGGGVATVTYQYDDRAPVALFNATGQALQMVPGQRYVIDATLDAETGMVSVIVDGTANGSALFGGGVPIHPGPLELARDTFGSPGVASSFPGKVEQLPVTVPDCAR